MRNKLFRTGDRVRKDGGVRLRGVVIAPFHWNDATDGAYRAPYPKEADVWVQWDDGTKGWIDAAWLIKEAAILEAALAEFDKES